ncbi:MAG: hypothetical protein H6Q61_1233 [Firmicutes bacterium]|nr:hypothetical protein [Bacillota bacterium]
MNVIQRFRGKLTLRQRIALLLGTLLLIVGLIFLVTYRDHMGLDLYTRYIAYDNEQGSVTYSHSFRGEDLFVGMDYRLLACSDTQLQLYSGTGDSLLRLEQLSFQYPALSTNGKQTVVYDAGGRALYVIAKNKVVFSLELPSGQYILSATINQNGWMAVTTKEDGHRGVVTIYDASYQRILSRRLSDFYPVNAAVTPDCRGYYILTPTQSKGIFDSRLLYFAIDGSEDTEAKSQISLGDNVVLSLFSSNSRTWALTDTGLFTLLSSGELASQYDFQGSYLKRASMDGSEFAALLLSPSQSGNTGTLVTVDYDGHVLGTVELEEQVLGLSAAGRYVAVLTSNSLHLYNKELREISTSDAIQGVRNLALFSDGTLALITDELVRLYIP